MTNPFTIRSLSSAKTEAVSVPAVRIYSGTPPEEQESRYFWGTPPADWPRGKKPLPPADQLMRDHVLKEEGGREVLLKLKRSVTFTPSGERVIPAWVVDGLLAGKEAPDKPAFLRKCEG